MITIRLIFLFVFVILVIFFTRISQQKELEKKKDPELEEEIRKQSPKIELIDSMLKDQKTIEEKSQQEFNDEYENETEDLEDLLLGERLDKAIEEGLQRELNYIDEYKIEKLEDTLFGEETVKVTEERSHEEISDIHRYKTNIFEEINLVGYIENRLEKNQKQKVENIDDIEIVGPIIENLDNHGLLDYEFNNCDSQLTNRHRISVKKILKERMIFQLLHFTNIENLNSILENGFLSIELQNKKGISGLFNDSDRFDNKLNTTSFSVEFPNYKMFYSLRNKNENSKWVVISIDPAILYLHKDNVYYCENNAASREIILRNKIELRKESSFRNMFRDKIDTRYYGTIEREQLNIPKSYPTDPQAEILIEGHISTKYIRSLYFESYNDLNLAENIIGTKIYKYDTDIINRYFRPRVDYLHWKRGY